MRWAYPMDESYSLGTAPDNIQLKPDDRKMPSSPRKSAEIHPVIANAGIVEDDPAPENHILQEPDSSTQEIDEDTELDICYDLSHISHDNPTAVHSGSEAADNNDAREDLTDIHVEAEEVHPLPTDGVLESSGEVEVWNIGRNHTVATVEDEMILDENAIPDEENSDAISVKANNNGVADILRSNEQQSGNEEAPTWLIIVALTFWSCSIVMLIGIYILSPSTRWDGMAIFKAVTLPLFHLSDGISLTQAKGVDFAAGAVIAPAFIGFANFTWFKIAWRLSPKTYVTTEMPEEQAGSFNISKIFGLVKMSKPQSILLAILLLSSALAPTLLSNVLGYKAIVPDDAKSMSTELLYQIVYIPGLLLPALCTITSASTAALLIAVLEWTSVLSKRKSGQVTDENDVGYENSATRAHNYVSFPRFRICRRLFPRSGIEIFSRASSDGETQPLLRRAQSQVDNHVSLGSWRLPSFEFPAFTFSRKVSDVEASGEAGTEQLVKAPRSSLALRKFPQISLRNWSRNQPSPTIAQQGEPQETSPQIPEPLNTPVAPISEYVRKGRKFWKLPTYGTIASLPVTIPTTEATSQAAQSSSVIPADTPVSLWKLPFPSSLLWPSGNWRTERRNRQREASEVSSLLSHVEPEQALLPHVGRTPSFWKVDSSTGHYTAPASEIPSKGPSTSEHLVAVPPPTYENTGVNPYSSESWRSWRVPRMGFFPFPRVSSEFGAGGTTTIPHEADEHPISANPSSNALSHTANSVGGGKSHKKQFSMSPLSWFPSFKFPLALVDVSFPDTEPPTLLPTFEEASSTDSFNSTVRTLTASEALNIAIGNQPISSDVRNEGLKGKPIQISSKSYTKNTETMSYNQQHTATSSQDQGAENVRVWCGKDSKAPAMTDQRIKPSGSWTHLPLFTSKIKWNTIHKASQPITPIRFPSDSTQSFGTSPAIVGPPTTKGKERERYVNQFESTIERVHEIEAPVLIHEDSTLTQPTKPKSNSGVGWAPRSSRQLRPHDVEATRSHGMGPTRRLSPLREIKGNLPQCGHQANDLQSNSLQTSFGKKDRASWTWWNVSWPRLIDVDNSRPPSTNASSRQISASSKTSTNDSKAPDLEAQKHTTESMRSNVTGSNDSFSKKTASYHIPQLSPVSVMIPNYLSPVPSKTRNTPGLSVPEQGEASSSMKCLLGTQFFIEGSKGKEPMKQASPTERPRVHRHHFGADEENAMYAEEGKGSGSSRKRDSHHRQNSQINERSVWNRVEEIDTETSAEIQGYLGF